MFTVMEIGLVSSREHPGGAIHNDIVVCCKPGSVFILRFHNGHYYLKENLL